MLLLTYFTSLFIWPKFQRKFYEYLEYIQPCLAMAGAARKKENPKKKVIKKPFHLLLSNGIT